MTKETRQLYTTYEVEEDFSIEKEQRFSMSLCVLEENSFDNEKAIGQRMSFVLVDQGAGVAILDGLQVPYFAPCIFCVNEQEHIIIGGDEGCSIRVLLFHPEMVNYSLNFENIRKLTEDDPVTLRQDRALLFAFINERRKYNHGLPLGVTSYHRVSEMIDGIQHHTQKQDSDMWPCRTRFSVMELLFILESLYETEGFSDEIKPERIKEDFTPILSYIYLHYKDKITVKDITEHFHIGKTTMAGMFRENVGDTFLNYLNKLRIQMATLMLRDTSLSVNEVMYQTGFSDMAHFLRMFKRYIGMTPSVYRERNS